MKKNVIITIIIILVIAVVCGLTCFYLISSHNNDNEATIQQISLMFQK